MTPNQMRIAKDIIDNAIAAMKAAAYEVSNPDLKIALNDRAEQLTTLQPYLEVVEKAERFMNNGEDHKLWNELRAAVDRLPEG